VAEQTIDKTISLADRPRIHAQYARWMQKGRGGLAQLEHSYPPDAVLTAEQLAAFASLRKALDAAVAVFHRPASPDDVRSPSTP
jgi:hypothetical protein